MRSILFLRYYISFFLYFLFFGNILSVVPLLHAEEIYAQGKGNRYYIRLKNEEFLQTMIPKEKFLLGIIQSVNEEISSRRSEGLRLSDLGMSDVTQPSEVIAEEYVQELQMMVQLLDEIEKLERKAKQKVDFRVLEALSNLKKQVLKIVERSTDDLGQSSLDFNNTKNKRLSPDNKTTLDVDETVNLQDTQVRTNDLFEEWKYNRILDYKVKLTEYQYLRTRLLKTANSFQKKRMFQRDLRRALESYSIGDFPISRLQLKDILSTYTDYRILDDVLFYCGESSYGLNYFDEALKLYYRLAMNYPQSSLCAKALIKIIYIYYIYGEVDKLFENYQKLLLHKSQLDLESFSTVSYLAGYAHFKAGEYHNSLKSIANVEIGTSYYFPSLYLSAACYSNVGNDDLALSIYKRLIDDRNKDNKDPVISQIRNNALLKLGLIYYDRKQHKRAMNYFNQVSKDFSHYDLSVIGKAWSAYQSGKPGEVLRNVEWLLRYSLASNYAYEARVLAASSKELLGYTDEAIEDLKQVFQAKSRTNNSTSIQPDRSASLQNVESIEDFERRFLEEKDREIFAEVQKIRRFLRGSSSVENGKVKFNKDFPRIEENLSEKIATLDKLEMQAKEIENNNFIKDIRDLRSDLIQTLQDHTEGFSGNIFMSEEDPLVKRMGITEYLKYLFRSLLLDTFREKEKTERDILEAENLIKKASEQDKFDLAVRMEIKKEELEDYYVRLNQYEVWLRENFPQEFRVELDQWATFSGYGISNMNFSKIKEIEGRIAQISLTIDALNDVFKAKRKKLDRRIKGLLNDVAIIEVQMRQEAEKREQLEKEKFFKIEYFEKQRQEPVGGQLHEKTDSGEGEKK